MREFRKEDLYHCLQCAVCTGSCPVSAVIKDYNPREIILRYSLGDRENGGFDDDLLWCCTTCNVCRERCPHEIDITGLLTDIANRAALNGHLPKTLRDGIRLVMETGRLVKNTKATERSRRDLGLSPLENPGCDEIRTLFRATGVEALLEE